jgi:hypothetical protein
LIRIPGELKIKRTDQLALVGFFIARKAASVALHTKAMFAVLELGRLEVQLLCDIPGSLP